MQAPFEMMLLGANAERALGIASREIHNLIALGRFAEAAERSARLATSMRACDQLKQAIERSAGHVEAGMQGK